MRNIHLNIILLIFFGCSSSEMHEYQRLNFLPIVDAIYKTTTFENDSVGYDKLKVCVNDKNFMSTYINDGNKGEIMKIIEYVEPFQIDSSGNSILRHTFINYDMIGDSIIYFDKSEASSGQIKEFKVDGNKHRIHKRPLWIWTKSKNPNYYEFYSDKYGLVLTLSKKRKTSLLYLPKFDDKKIEKLVCEIESDKNFFSMK